MLFRAITTLIAAGGLALAVGSTAACGGGGEGYKLPVTSPLVPYKKPTRAELVPDEAKPSTPKPKGPMPDMGDDDDSGSANPTKSAPPAGSKKNAATNPKKSGKKK